MARSLVPRVVSPKKVVGSKMYKGRCSEKLTDKTWPKVGSNWSDSRKGTRVVGPKLPINVIICFQAFCRYLRKHGLLESRTGNSW